VSARAQLARITARLDRLEAAARPPAPADPVTLAARVGLVLDPWQARVMASRAQTLLLCCGRQVGKSTVVALLIVAMLLEAERTVVIISPSERQSKELLRRVLTLWRKLGRPVAHTSVTRTSLELVNYSRLEALPSNEDTVRGISAVDLLVAEEAALVPDGLYGSVSPMLAVSNGRLVAPSTPRGKRGWWHGLWSMRPADDPDIERVEVPATLCPRISARFLERERRRIGHWWYSQEYECRFSESGEGLISYEDAMASISDAVRPLFAS
jgi:hypothetical protein